MVPVVGEGPPPVPALRAKTPGPWLHPASRLAASGGAARHHGPGQAGQRQAQDWPAQVRPAALRQAALCPAGGPSGQVRQQRPAQPAAQRKIYRVAILAKRRTKRRTDNWFSKGLIIQT